MKRYLEFIALGASIFLFGCHEENKPTTIYFGDLRGGKPGRIEILEGSPEGTVANYGPGVYLSQPAPSDITISFSSVGTAGENTDFIITNPLIVRKGYQFTSLNLKFIDDKTDEFNEPGDLIMQSIEGAEVSVLNDTAKFLILDDDVSDLQISVSWSNVDSDLDLYLWREKVAGSNEFELVTKSENRPPFASPIFAIHEDANLSGLEKDGLYALSYLYYSGTLNLLNFKVNFKPSGTAILDGGKTILEFNATYKSVNLNSGTAPKKVQFFVKEGNQYHSFTDISVPESGS